MQKNSKCSKITQNIFVSCELWFNLRIVCKHAILGSLLLYHYKSLNVFKHSNFGNFYLNCIRWRCIWGNSFLIYQTLTLQQTHHLFDARHEQRHLLHRVDQKIRWAIGPGHTALCWQLFAGLSLQSDISCRAHLIGRGRLTQTQNHISVGPSLPKRRHHRICFGNWILHEKRFDVFLVDYFGPRQIGLGCRNDQESMLQEEAESVDCLKTIKLIFINYY